MTETFTKSTLTISNKSGTEILKGVLNVRNGMWTINMETPYKRKNQVNSVYKILKKKYITAFLSQ